MEIKTESKRGRKPLDFKIELDSQPQEVKKRGTPVGWRPASVLPRLVARNGFTAKWMRNDSGHIAAKQEEGWIIMKPSDNVGVEIRQDYINDANSLGTEIRFRDMIAMMLPDDLKQARSEHYKKEFQSAVAQPLRETDSALKHGKVRTYTPQGMAGRIVIE